MKNIELNISDATDFLDSNALENSVGKGQEILLNFEKISHKTDQFLGWLDLPDQTTAETLQEIKNTAGQFKSDLDTVVCIGIGGSYLGARAVIDALTPYFSAQKENEPEIIFAGHQLDEDYYAGLLETLESRNYGIIVISKSGTTTEPGIAFRIIKEHLEHKVGKTKASQRIIAITDEEKGALRQLAKDENYTTFSIPDNIGGRYSVLTPVGLVPIAVAGFDIEKLVEGARIIKETTYSGIKKEENQALHYAAVRHELYKKERFIEMMGFYNHKLHYLAEWWKQLFGESEGKEGKGIFPTVAAFTTDLHSLGQYIQEGRKNIFETIISLLSPKNDIHIPKDKDNLDKLNYLSGKRIHEINAMAEAGTRLAHTEGEVPNIYLTVPAIEEYYIGQLIQFFEVSCAVSGGLLGVNPFNQPGVEAYKNNMFALLQKPGFETESQRLLETINQKKSNRNKIF
jgi:glucose-6-phosphate isomerase